MTLIYESNNRHRCPVTLGSWYVGKNGAITFVHEYDGEFTVRACPDCGKTFVATYLPGRMTAYWIPETFIHKLLRRIEAKFK